jgi:hypothetical protein
VSKAYVPVRQDPEKMRFIEWLTTPPAARQPATEAEFARMIDVHVKTLYNWKHDREFRETWQGETDQIIGDLDKRQRVLDALFEAHLARANPHMLAIVKGSTLKDGTIEVDLAGLPGADAPPDARGIADEHGRLMVLMVHNTDLPDPWEREGEDKDYFYRFSPDAYAVGINILLYAMSH